ncbi:MAG: molybdopterin cofactor-binding domain-containing protein, partial [Rhodococcus sp. (in: high G+C Gram-positive bacteria)]
FGYGDLAEDAMALATPAREELIFKTEDEFRYIGKGSVQITDIHDISTGAAIYGADVQVDGLKYAVIARSPVVGATVVSVDDSAALATPGVEQIVQIPVTGLGSKFQPLGGVAVIANSTWAAIQGRDALEIEWDRGEHGSFTTAAYKDELSASANATGTTVRAQGDPDGALASAAKVLSLEYYQPHLSHSPMEPPVATAQMVDDHMEIWAPVQSPYVARTDTATYIGLDPADVTMNVTLLGGAFGRKSKADFATEAAFLAKETGLPIRVQWTREDDIRHSYYHTSSVEKIDIGIDANNEVTAWRHRSAAPSFLSTFAPDSGVQHEIEIGMGLENLPYDLPNIGAEQCKAFAHTRVGWYRSVSNIPRCFAVQSATAELANELGKDQKDFLLELLGSDRILDPATSGLAAGKWWNQYEPYDEFPYDTGRLRNVIELAAEKAGWGQELPEGEALGIAAHRSFVTYVATVVRVKMVDGVPTVPEAHVAVDAGFIANPERVRSQMQGACVFGMSAAMYQGIEFENGEVVNSNFHDYEMVRSDNFPEEVHTHLVDHPFEVHATGIGEPGVPPFLPAFTNAIFNASGKRIRNLPIGDQLA